MSEATLSIQPLHRLDRPLALPPPEYDRAANQPMSVAKILMKMGAMNGKFFSMMNEHMIEVTDDLEKLIEKGIATALPGGVAYKRGPYKKRTQGTIEDTTSQKQVTDKLSDTISGLLDDTEDNSHKRRNSFEGYEEEHTKKRNKVLDSIVDKFDKIKDSLGDFAENAKEDIFDTIVGPFKLITRPIEEAGGFKFFDVFKKDKYGVGKRHGKDDPEEGLYDLFLGRSKDPKKKIRPERQQILNKTPMGEGFVYLGDKISGEGENKEDKKKGFLSDLFSGLGEGGIIGIASKVFPALLKALPFAAIAASLIWGVIDAIKGIAMAEKWGTSKVAAGIGAFLGGTGEGWKNAFANAGKFALMGAGIGFLAGGPIGALAGGLIGAAIGGLLGYIGGQRIAKFLDAVGKIVKLLFHDAGKYALAGFAIGGPLGAVVGLMTGVAINALMLAFGDNTVTGKLLRKISGWFNDTFDSVMGFITGIFVDKKDPRTGKIRQSLIKQALPYVESIGKNIFSFFNNAGIQAVDFVKKGAQDIGSFAASIIPTITSVFSHIVDGVTSFLDNHPILKSVVDTVLTPITWVTDFFKNVVVQIGRFVQDPVKYIQDAFDIVKKGILGFFSGIGNFFHYVGSLGILEIGKQVVTNTFGEGLAQYSENRNQLTGLVNQKGTTAFQNSLFRTKYQNMGISQAEDELLKSGNSKDLSAILKYLSNSPDVKVQDAIIRPDGKVISTDPNDTLVALKNGGKDQNSSFSDLIQYFVQLLDIQNRQLQELKKGQGSAIVNNFTSRYLPTNIMKNLGVEVI